MLSSNTALQKKKEAIRWFLEFRLPLVSWPCRVNMLRFPDDIVEFLPG